jgi:hypothetical protein
MAASVAFSFGSIIPLNPSFFAVKAMGRIPLRGFKLPSSILSVFHEKLRHKKSLNNYVQAFN